MWLSEKLVGIVQISKETVDQLRIDLAKVTAERDAARGELATVKANFAWSTQQINDLQYQNKALIQKAYGINVPVPEIVRPTAGYDPTKFDSDIFEDMGEERAKSAGMPSYSDKH